MIKDIIQKIREQQELTKKEIVPDPRTYNTQLGNIKRAQENLDMLFMELRDEVRKNMVLILASGKNAEDFAKIAEAEFSCISMDAEGVFKQIAGYVSDDFIGKVASPSIIDIAMGAMSDLSHEIGILGYNYPQFKTNPDARQLNTRKDLEELIMQVFNREIGAELVALKAVHDATRKIMDTDFEGKKVPLVLFSQNKELMEKIAQDSKALTSRVFLVNNTKKPTSESVENKLIELSKQS